MDDGSQPQDIVQQGGDDRGPSRFRWPGGRLTRPAQLLAAVTLAAGLAVGYVAGHQQGRESAAAPAPASTVTVTPAAAGTAPTVQFSGGEPLVQGLDSCETQGGLGLEVGVDFVNQSAAAVVLQSATVVSPPSGLRQVAARWAVCGQQSGALSSAKIIVLSGQGEWLTVTFRVASTCPPSGTLQFAVRYLVDDQLKTASLSGFSDLSSVLCGGRPAS